MQAAESGGIYAEDAHLRRLGERIRRKQAELRRLVDARAWSVYLQIEELANERFIETTERAVRVASGYRVGSRK